MKRKLIAGLFNSSFYDSGLSGSICIYRSLYRQQRGWC